MKEIEIDFPVTLDADAVVAAVEHVGTSEALVVTMKSTLKKFPGCTHWHFKTHKERGVLEVTWWPGRKGTKPSRLWLSAHNNRKADWMIDLIPRLKAEIEALLSA